MILSHKLYMQLKMFTARISQKTLGLRKTDGGLELVDIDNFLLLFH